MVEVTEIAVNRVKFAVSEETMSPSLCKTCLAEDRNHIRINVLLRFVLTFRHADYLGTGLRHMKDRQEVVLAVLEGTLESERTLLVHRLPENGRSLIELRQQSWGDGVGWFTQNSVQLEPEQVAQLRLALGTPKAIPSRTPVASGTFVPRLVTADSA